MRDSNGSQRTNQHTQRWNATKKSSLCETKMRPTNKHTVEPTKMAYYARKKSPHKLIMWYTIIKSWSSLNCKITTADDGRGLVLNRRRTGILAMYKWNMSDLYKVLCDVYFSSNVSLDYCTKLLRESYREKTRRCSTGLRYSFRQSTSTLILPHSFNELDVLTHANALCLSKAADPFSQ